MRGGPKQMSSNESKRVAARARYERWHAKRYPRLTPAELEECQQDPTKAWTIRGPRVIACIEDGCGELHARLGLHLTKIHGLTPDEYKRKPGFGGTVPRYNRNASCQ